MRLQRVQHELLLLTTVHIRLRAFNGRKRSVIVAASASYETWIGDQSWLADILTVKSGRERSVLAYCDVSLHRIGLLSKSLIIRTRFSRLYTSLTLTSYTEWPKPIEIH